ncbi:hypothetical protein [Novosphingobium sp.]|uniref:CC_3452 family protein n=1 Tax=Novosphingobium sp. TaxID=1874826 RepID=UPI0025E5954E|nr:hypothetical protein [Novosphingobium sp.]MCC6926255.1 hypothetical protein [Novosphingobium sp.]
MTAISQQFSRGLLAAGLALAGTVLSFSATTTPAHAGASRNVVKLSTALAAPKSKVVNGVIWNCAGDTCTAPIDGSRPEKTCAQVVKAFGTLSAFTGPKGEFGAEDLQRCNAAA